MNETDKDKGGHSLRDVQAWIVENIDNVCSVNVPIKIYEMEGDGGFELLQSEIEVDITDSTHVGCRLCEAEFKYKSVGGYEDLIQQIISHAKSHMERQKAAANDKSPTVCICGSREPPIKRENRIVCQKCGRFLI